MPEIRDFMPFEYTISLDEGESGNKWLIVEGVSQRADAGNANKRVYPRQVLESALNSLQESLKSRSVLGELDHPDDGRSSLKRISHIVLEAFMEPNGDVRSKILVLNNPLGEQLKELFRAGVRVGISSRGSGSVRPGSGQWQGYQIVQEDYRLSTWDFVVQPSTHGAYMDPTNESKPVLTTEGTEEQDNYDASYGMKIQPKQAPATPAVAPVAPVHHGHAHRAAQEVNAEGHAKPGTLGHDVATLPQATSLEVAADEPKCAFGAHGCGKSRSLCTCLSAFDKQKNEEDEQKPMTNKNKKVVESLVRQNRITERIAAADRAASGKLFGALIDRLRAITAAPAQAESVDTSKVANLEAQLEALSVALSEAKNVVAALTNENTELKKVVATVKAKIAEAVEEDSSTHAPEVVSFVESLIANDPDAADWKDYLLEAEDTTEAKARHSKMKDVVMERNTSDDLPKAGSKSQLTESRSTSPGDPGVRLFKRAAQSMGRQSRHLGHTTNGIR